MKEDKAMTFSLIGNHEKDKRANRDGYISAMLELMKNDPLIAHIDCDLMGCINSNKLQAAFPDRTFNAGIAEQNAMGVAGGMAASGMKVFMHSFGSFASRRDFDQALLAAGYSRVPVHVIGSDPGVCAAFNGATHMPLEDAGLYMAIPNAVVLDPCDYVQTYSLTKKCAACDELTYLRLIRKGFKTVYADGSEFEIGKGVVLKEGKDVTIISSGILLDEALKAQEILAAKGVSAKVIDMFTWKPLDEELILSSAEETGCIVTAENHQVGSGLGSAVANVLVKNKPVPVEMIGVQNRFGQVGDQGFLMKEYNLLAEDIVKAAERAMARK
jgi:transketolase